MSLNKSKALRTAEKYVLQGKIPAAIDEYRKVVSADPGDLTTINTLGDLYVRAGRIQDAIFNFSRIADSYREGGFTLKAIAMLKKISKLDPTNVETAMKLANLYSQQGLLVEARQQYLQVADAYARAGQTRKALEAYQKIADLDPSNTSVRMKLGDIYSREGMKDQSHDAYIMAGAEFLRKGDIEQALNANLKAIVINADSRQALTAIATIYTQQGQTDRAINLLCEAFERNPGDVELLTILGRTYLAAGMMDDAERTFLSLIELDKNRHHYLLEVGRRFLQIGDLDRAAEQIDGCIEVLIAKREEDKAIDFLRRVLDKEMNHIGALKRLAQVYLRIREDHNLITTLNSLVEAAMRHGNDQEAIAALKELIRLEPEEPLHLQRLYNLGVQDIVEADSPDVVRATGPLDFQSAAFDDTFVIRQISEAEILAGHGQMGHAVEILSQILVHAPENVQVHLKLKDIYLRAGVMDKASQECLRLAQIHEGRGEAARASDYTAEAHQLDPLISSQAVLANASESTDYKAGSFGAPAPEGAVPLPGDAGGGFEITESSGLDWNRYETGTLADSGFVTIPEDLSGPQNGAGAHNGSSSGSSSQGSGFRYGDMLTGDAAGNEGAPAADMVFSSASLLPSDTMPRVLRDELEGIDFYIAQGYVEIARDTLDRLRIENGEHPEILARYNRLGGGFNSVPPELIETELSEPVEVEPAELVDGVVLMSDSPSPEADSKSDEMAGNEFEITVSDEDKDNGKDAPAGGSSADGSEETIENKPFFIQKESGPLYPDLVVQLNTSELRGFDPFEAMRPMIDPALVSEPVEETGKQAQRELDHAEARTQKAEPLAEEPRAFDLTPVEPPANHPTSLNAQAFDPAASTQERIGTGDLIQSLVSSLDLSFDAIHRPEPGPAEFSKNRAADSPMHGSEVVNRAETEVSREARAVDGVAGAIASSDKKIAGDELREIFEELKEQTGDLMPLLDFETHYSLGLAYKDMDLLDEAISEFQMAFRTAGIADLEGDCINCCNMLGVCFKRKQMFKVAVMWFERGLSMQNRTEDEYQALRFEIGLCLEEMGEFDKAIETFTEVYGIDVNYRKVGDNIKEMRAAKA